MYKQEKKNEKKNQKDYIFWHFGCILLVIFILLWIAPCIEKGPKIKWIKAYGRTNDDVAFSIQQTEDGGYIVAGGTNSFGAGGEDVYIIKLDENGNKEWERTYGGEYDDVAWSIQQTRDEGYVVAGSTKSIKGKLNDVYIIRLDRDGNKMWEKTYGGKGDDIAYSIQQTRDEGYVVAGSSITFGKNKSKTTFLLKLDRDGNKIWEKKYKLDSVSDFPPFITQTKDKGYILVGGRYFSDSARSFDVYIIKLDEKGNKEWEKIYPKEGDEIGICIQELAKGGFIIGGTSYSSNNTKGFDVYIIRLDRDGNKIWEKTYPKEGDEIGWFIIQTMDKGFAIIWWKYSFEFCNNNVNILKLDENGNKEWERVYGGRNNDVAFSIQQTEDGGYIVAGGTNSFGAGGEDVYIIKLDENGNKD